VVLTLKDRAQPKRTRTPKAKPSPPAIVEPPAAGTPAPASDPELAQILAAINAKLTPELIAQTKAEMLS
jgi:hypothetical protein